MLKEYAEKDAKREDYKYSPIHYQPFILYSFYRKYNLQQQH